jgi:hypothetical protein
MKNIEEGKVSWFVSLFGSENEKELLRDFLDLPNCRLVQAKEKNKGCYLTASRFSNLADDEEVCESAKKLLTMIKAFAKIELGGDFQSINVGGRGKIVVDSENAATIIRSLDGNVEGNADVFTSGITATATFKANVANVVIQDEDDNVVHQESLTRPERWFDHYLNRCDEEIDRVVFDALYHFAQVTSWFSLYEIYEHITFDICDESNNKAKDKMIKDGWVDEGKLNDFLFSAQYYDVVGGAKDAYLGSESSRHSLAQYLKDLRKQKKSKADNPQDNIMHLPEAENLMGHILEKWLKSKQTS